MTVDSLALSLSLFSKRGCSRSALEEEQGDGTSLACLPHELATFSPSKNSIQAVPISMIYIDIMCSIYTILHDTQHVISGLDYRLYMMCIYVYVV